jgi:alpha-1,2-mannosyltransferase
MRGIMTEPGSGLPIAQLTGASRHAAGWSVVSSAARVLWLLFLIDALLLTATLRMAGAADGESIVRPVRHFLAAIQQTDSWRPMQIAEQYLSSPHERPVYDEMLDARHVKFQYPLTSLLFTRHLSLEWLNAISWFSIVSVIVAAWLILRRSSTGTPLELGQDDPAAALALVGLTLSFYPIVEAYSLGQIQAWINALLACAILAWLTRREDLAGVAIGFACLLKPTYVLFAVWGLLRRRTRFLVPMAGVVLLGGLAALVAYGVADNVNYLHALAKISQGETFYPNQSFNGLLNRLVGNGDSLKFDRAAFAAFHPLVYAGAIFAFVFLTGLALWIPMRQRVAGDIADFVIMMLTVTMTSPVAWTHHYGVLLPIFAAMAPAVVLRAPFGRWTRPLIFACYVCASQSLALTNRLAGTAFGVFQSYLLIASLVILGMLYSLLYSRPVGAIDSSLAS